MTRDKTPSAVSLNTCPASSPYTESPAPPSDYDFPSKATKPGYLHLGGETACISPFSYEGLSRLVFLSLSMPLTPPTTIVGSTAELENHFPPPKTNRNNPFILNPSAVFEPGGELLAGKIHDAHFTGSSTPRQFFRIHPQSPGPRHEITTAAQSGETSFSRYTSSVSTLPFSCRA